MPTSVDIAPSLKKWHDLVDLWGGDLLLKASESGVTAQLILEAGPGLKALSFKTSIRSSSIDNRDKRV